MSKQYDEYSAGIIVYNQEEDIKYLLLYHGGEYWNFPKGKMEKEETEIETALRELSEETNIKQVEIVDGFEESYSYSFKSRGKNIKKLVKMYLGRYLGGTIILSHEHLDYTWYSYDKAMSILNYSNIKSQLTAADTYLKSLT